MAQTDVTSPEICIAGSDCQGGAYVLRIRLAKDARVCFGRFRKGEAITMPAGTYLYVGSARSAGNTRALGRRLLRHATRSGRKRPQVIRNALAARLVAAGLVDGADITPRAKRLRWHVDYLLDLCSAEITGVWAVRTDRTVERDLSRRLADDADTEIVWKGLGASDDPGGTHLFRVRDEDRVWRRVVQGLGDLWRV